jgi:oxepin-CoA hydrolase/3-oxo-5,6-dehydrosuberyl-CoA semialdehyde dehydrogenase
MATEKIQSYVNGGWGSSSEEGFTLVNPATEDALATASAAGLDLAGALAFARKAGGPELRALSFAQRGELLARMSSVLHGAREMLIDSAVANGGCTRSDAKFDIDGAIGTLSVYADLGKSLGNARVLADGEGIQLGRSPRFWAQHIFVPRAGVALLVNAFNFPAWGFAEKASCAILAGMPVVTKPATATALTAYHVTRLLVEANVLPKGALGFIAGSTPGIVEHLDVQDVLAFTGSASTAVQLRGHPHVIGLGIHVNVEADSLNAAVLGPDVALGSDTATLFLRDVVRDMTQKTGQKCTAIRRIFVPEPLVKEVEAELASRLSEIKIGNPALKEVGMGPVATSSQLRDVRAGVSDLAVDADVVLGDVQGRVQALGAESGRGYFHPVVLLRARNSESASHVHEHEVFGPVATILSYSGNAEHAAELVKLGRGGLVASVYSDDRAFTENVALGVAPYHGRLYLGSAKVLEHATGPGLVLPTCVHGGPGRAGGGEELGGIRGVMHYMQRTVLQGSRPIVEGIAGTKPVGEP